ncbi:MULTISPECIES: ABC transporter substrate-binding protein [Dictyoglomus]|uniref:Extracellular solute-binding protein family 1 n=1 Tax=Dictyoglomus turgidum (strain DSM 6724 / Z-1310) TaxID=515635 RepID=B8DZA5_DICTD|nr:MULTISPECIES: ABC transporter substrate-binding protein [Dictyoglomus]ACK41838.1 extracellular solute-binding protein family 1 [Dictyoglomus turgidum DSM 6724]HBU31307.1 carbohydrate ABC transporter substrate-binding protein [Dictyoglomus sp.]
MKLRKVLSLILVLSFIIFLNLGGLNAAEKVKITLLSTKGEINAALEGVAKDFSKDYPNISLEIIPVGVGQSPFEKLSTMYASGNAPTLAMIDVNDVPKFKENFLDLSNEEWVKDAVKGALNDITFDKKVMAFPFTIEGYGLIYNQQAIEKVIGKFDPKTIDTRNKLEALFKKLEEKGLTPIVVSPLDWSLGAHFLTIGYVTQSSDPKKIDKFIEDLKAGKIDLSKNRKMNGLLDTLDMWKKYNYLKRSPLAGTYEQGAQLLATGKVAFWFMGNWAWPLIKEVNPNNVQYGFLPVFVSNIPNDYGNREIPVGVTKVIGIDMKQNSREQQEAARTFLNWLVYNKNGQNAWVNKLSVITPFKNVKLTPNDPLAKSIFEYMNQGRTLRFLVTLPPDHWPTVGASMQKYLANVISREQLFKEITDYWRKVK